MSILVNILDALRTFGRATQKSALRRQDAQLEGKEVLGRRLEQVRTELGAAEAFKATVVPTTEVVVQLTDEELGPIHRNGDRIVGFFSLFLGSKVANWSVDELDVAFAAWSNAENHHGYTASDVIQILGAAFGELCVAELRMRWIWVVDSAGKSLALQGIDKDFRAFPFHSIEKRITDAETVFFKPIFISLQSASQRSGVAATNEA